MKGGYVILLGKAKKNILSHIQFSIHALDFIQGISNIIEATIIGPRMNSNRHPVSSIAVKRNWIANNAFSVLFHSFTPVTLNFQLLRIPDSYSSNSSLILEFEILFKQSNCQTVICFRIEISCSIPEIILTLKVLSPLRASAIRSSRD